MTRRILILGGTTEARQLAGRLAHRGDLSVSVSLAGRTAEIVEHPVPVRVGGFGGVAGLAEYLQREGIDVLVDATHPYAAIISRNAPLAAKQAGVDFLALRRPAWKRRAGDQWLEVADVAGAVAALGSARRRVFVALGRKELAPFAAAPQHAYVIRSIDPVGDDAALPDATYITGRGPFDEADEHALLAAHRVERLVSRNSGGAAAYGKIAAARDLGIEVLMIRRPALPEVNAVESIDSAVAWFDHDTTSAAARGV